MNNKEERALILLVDDEPGVEMIFSKILNDQGYEVRHFTNAEDALAAIQSDSKFGLSFLDIRLPGEDGISALPKFLKFQPSLKVVMMTAYQTVESVVTAMKFGAADYLVKPLEPEMILKAVEKYFPSGQPVFKEEKKAQETKAVRSYTFMARTPLMKNVLSVADKFASVSGPVLILGESGTGKEMLAHTIHQKSQRAKKPLIIVDCTSIPETLFESELFGYEKGAFTGADTAKVGRFELADGGTLFLDEIGNVPLTMQAKLLRFIEDHTVSRLGGKKTIDIDIRLITATNVDLQKEVEKGKFRQDLFYRLSTLTIHLPPLRNRIKEEKEFLINYFLEKNSQKLQRPVPVIAEPAMQMLLEYAWPGNVRELENALYSSALLCDSNKIGVQHLTVGIQSYFSHKEQVELPIMEGEKKTLKEVIKKVEKEQILAALEQTGGNKKKASEMLDMDYKTFLTKLKEYSPT